MSTTDPRDRDYLFTALHTKLPGASRNGINTELFGTLKEFFQTTDGWYEDIFFNAPVTSIGFVFPADQTGPNLMLTPVQDGGMITRLIGVWDDHQVPIPAFMPSLGVIQFVDPITQTPTSQWFAKVAKNVVWPTDNSGFPLMPDWVLANYGEHILDGVLGRMMMQQDKSYSNQTEATYHLRRFRTGMAAVRTAIQRMNTKGAQEWAYPRQFAPGGSQRGGVSTAWPTRAF